MNNDVLIVEPDDEVARVIVVVVEGLGDTATITKTPDEASAEYGKRKPWLLIVSEQIPQVAGQEGFAYNNGERFLRALGAKYFSTWQSYDAFCNDPERPDVLMLPDRYSPIDRMVSGSHWPVDMYLHKPFNARDVGQYVRRLKMDREKRRTSPDLELPYHYRL